MEKRIRQQAKKIAISQGLDAEREAVVAYGLIAIVQIAITLSLVTLFGFLVGAPIEALIVCLSVSILRKYSGGVHADNADFCTFFSVVYCTVTAVLSKWIAGIYQPMWMLGAMLAVYLLSFYYAYRYVPVDSPNKPIKTEKKIKRMRNGSFIILAIYAATSALFYWLSTFAPLYRSLGISLLFGVAWQVLTLTPLGAVLLHKLNDLPKIFRKETKL